MIPGDDEFKEIDTDNLNEEEQIADNTNAQEDVEEVAVDSTVTVQPVQNMKRITAV